MYIAKYTDRWEGLAGTELPEDWDTEAHKEEVYVEDTAQHLRQVHGYLAPANAGTPAQGGERGRESEGVSEWESVRVWVSERECERECESVREWVCESVRESECVREWECKREWECFNDTFYAAAVTKVRLG